MSNIISDITLPFVQGQTIRDRFLAKAKAAPPNTVPNSLRVFLIREPFDDFYLIYLDDGKSEEMEEMDVRQWMADRGAEEDLIDRAVNQARNFYSASVIIPNPRTPPKIFDPVEPNIE